MPAMDFTEVMRKKRRELKLTLGAVAEALGYSISHVSDVERGRRAPFDDKLEILAGLFQMPVEELREAAQLTRGITLETAKDDPLRREHQDAALALARTWGRLNKRQLKRIVEATEQDPDESGEEERCP